MITDIKYPVSSREFHDRLYNGEILCFRDVAEMHTIVERSRELAEEALAPRHPTRAHEGVAHKDLVEIFTAYQKRYVESAEIRELWAQFFEAIGLDPDTIARDRLRARVQTPISTRPEDGTGLVTAPLAFHRDTWGSNLYAQINWWAPLYPITPERTMEIFPDLWDKVLPNTTASFDLKAVMKRRREAMAQKRDANDVIPHLLDDFDYGKGEPVVIEPGDMLAFSGAHAHGSVINKTEITRLSLETRTVLVDDVKNVRGAPNVDGKAPWMSPGFFKRVSDGEALSKLIDSEPVCAYILPDG